jgi:hypothetical protein
MKKLSSSPTEKEEMQKVCLEIKGRGQTIKERGAIYFLPS